MKPKIGIGIRNLKEFSFEKYPFDCYEFTSKIGGIEPNILKILELKERFKGKDLSLHSQLGRIFSCTDRGCPEFNEAELEILKSEIIISKIVGIKQIIFHMKETEFTKEEIRLFNEVIKFANKKGIELIYENHVCSEEIIFKVLETFPEVNFCLDLGHLNLAIQKGKFKINLEEFLEKIKYRLTNIHAHNNDGMEDSHNSLDEGNFPWGSFLDRLKNKNLKKIIVECKKEEDCLKSKKLLEKHYNGK